MREQRERWPQVGERDGQGGHQSASQPARQLVAVSASGSCQNGGVVKLCKGDLEP